MSHLGKLTTAALLTLVSIAPLAAQQATPGKTTTPKSMARPASPPATTKTPAATAPAAPAATTAPTTTITVREAKPGLLARATVKPEAAEATALHAVPSGKLVNGTLEERGKALVYVFRLTGANNSNHEVTINAMTGAIVPAARPAKKNG